ncbi:MAG: heme o synthase [Candidatus Thermoplasmatota archaeon]
MSERTARSIAADYLAISKPRILLLLLIVAWAAMFVAAGGLPDWKAFLAVTLGGSFSTAASGAFNNVIEKGRDGRMARTANRPVAAGRITRTAATAYAAVMSLLSFAVLWLPGYHMAALLTVGAIAYYVVVYTALLKPTTPQNIVIGGLAGSFPALIGWAAQTGGLAWPGAAPALVLAALVFVWTPAHFWSLALLYKDDYAAAEYPMMPNVRGEASTRRQIFVYAVATLLTSLLLIATQDASWVYLVAAVGLGGLLVGRSWSLLVTHNPSAYRGYFFFTIQYLGLLLVALMVDRVVPLPDLPF